MNDHIQGPYRPSADFVPARPVLHINGSLFTVFYPLYGLVLPVLSASHEAAVARLMRKKAIQLRCEPSQRVDPTLVFCQDCKLGAAGDTQHDLTIRCIHRTWTSKPGTSALAVQLLGGPIAWCDVCGNNYHSDPNEWTYLGDNPPFLRRLRLCGDRCRERVYALPPLVPPF